MDKETGLRILVVENEAPVAEMLTEILEVSDHTVIGTAIDGREALEMTSRLEPNVLLLDLHLPDMDGLEVARVISERHPVPIVGLTADHRPELEDESARSGIGAVLSKPPNGRELDRAIAVARARFADILELRRLNERLTSKINERDTIIQTTADGFWMMDIQGKLVEVNQACADMLGYSKKEMLGLRFDDIEVFESHKESLRYIQKARRTGADRFETRHRRKDGRTIDVEVSTTYLRQQDVFIVFSRDITERKRAEEALKKSERTFRATFETSPDSININRVSDGVYFDVNDSFLQIMGYKKEEVLGRSSKDLSIWADSADRARLVAELDEHGFVENMEAVFNCKDGSPRHGLMSARLFDIDGVPCILSITRDITERKRSQEALAMSEARYRSLFESSPEPIVVLSFDGTILDHNQDECPLGLRREEMLGKKLFDLEVLGIVQLKEFFDRVKEGDTRPTEVKLGTKTGSRGAPIIVDDLQAPSPLGWSSPEGHVALTSFMTLPVFQGGRIAAVVGVGNRETPYLETERLQLTLLMDSIWKVLERQRAEMEKTLLQTQLQQAMKMEAVGRLAGGVAHDFNNLLLGIVGNVEFALMDLEAGDPLEDSLVEIGKAADRAANLTKQLLAFSRKQLIEPKVLSLNELISSMHRMLVRLIGEDIKLETRPGRHLGAVKVDPGQFEQILVNLVINARDAMPDGGKLVIETSNVSFDEELCRRHPHTHPGPYVLLTVNDTGLGMNEETKRHLFEPFFTTKPKGHGTGLGLATIYGAVKQANGSIEVSSEEGEGTTFRIYLPAVAEKAERLARDSRGSKMPGGGETILVVEDEKSVRDMAVKILERLGYSVLQAPDGGQAFMLAEGCQEPIHLLMTDVVMPGMNGRQLADRLVKLHSELKVLFTSGYAEDTIAHHGILDEGLNFIGKPYTPQALAKKIREVLDDPQ